MPTPLPRWDRLGPVAVSPSDGSLPRNTDGSALTIWCFEACSAFTHVSACLLAEPPERSVSRGLDGFVTSSAAPVATGWSGSSPDGTCTHWKSLPLHGAQYLHLTAANGFPLTFTNPAIMVNRYTKNRTMSAEFYEDHRNSISSCASCRDGWRALYRRIGFP